MKRVYNNWLVRATLGFAAMTGARVVSTLLHMTTLDKLYKPRDFRRTSHIELSDEITSSLPRYCQTVYGLKMDPINLMFIGTEAGLRRAFEKAGWHGAHPSTPVHLFLGLVSSVFRRSYKQGPFMPLFVDIGMQDLAFQKTTKTNKFAQRHHIRIWRTRHKLGDRNYLWVAAATHETGMKVVWLPPFIVHRMDPDLDYERDFIAGELIEQGHLMAGDHQLNDAIKRTKPKRNPNNDHYYSDGRAKAIEIV
ncbi:MAG TPA: LssY C-terminal domain-containing protein [Candidatus Saccharimonadales bacterium]|nr:LssY C-terminal domain-containing protein [Candidatus Saccharimonadales bacterium]